MRITRRITMDEQIKSEKTRSRLEIKLLQSQMNPHFLYNTLDSIVWMAEWGKNEEVVTMTSALAKLLRETMGRTGELGTVAQELTYIRNYLTIQQMRYQDLLTYEIVSDQEIEHVMLLRLVLQPFVENAIYHGIKYREGPGYIHIAVRDVGDDLILTVEDNGVGMDVETLGHIYEERPKEEHNEGRSNHFAVRNINDRLRLIYGEEYSLGFESEVGKGTLVTLRLRKIFDGGGAA